MPDQPDLVRALMPEVFQAERSASRHPRVEARRLGNVPPAEALLSVASHADVSLLELTAMADTLGLRGATAGQGLGTTFSLLREGLADHLVDPSRSYRGTLLGIHHCLDLVRLLRAAAARDPRYVALVDWCDRWLATRSRLAEACVGALDWFAEHPEEATFSGWRAPLERAIRTLDGAVAAGMRRGLGMARA